MGRAIRCADTRSHSVLPSLFEKNSAPNLMASERTFYESRTFLWGPGHAVKRSRAEYPQASSKDWKYADPMARDEVLRSLWAYGFHSMSWLPSRGHQTVLFELQ